MQESQVSLRQTSFPELCYQEFTLSKQLEKDHRVFDQEKLVDFILDNAVLAYLREGCVINSFNKPMNALHFSL